MVRLRCNAQGGFSLIEALVGVAIIGVTAALIPPVITLSVAARAQNQRVEQAVRLAQGHMDLVRLRMERGLAGGTVAAFVADLDLLAPLGSDAPPAASALASAPFCNLRSPSTPVGPPCRVDINGDGLADFGLQAFRIRQETAPNGLPISFAFGVRVYPRAVVQGTYTGALGIRPAVARLGAPEAASNPLAVQYSRILLADSSRSLGSICRTLGGDATSCATLD